MKRCPPGVICIDTFIIIICLIGLVYLFFKNQQPSPHNQDINITTNLDKNVSNGQGYEYRYGPSYPYNNLPTNDILGNPYAAPLRDERYFVPINVSTSAQDTTYRQIGILTPLNGSSKDNILPLMGRPLFTRRSLWQYYTISNQHNNVKLPVVIKGKSGLNDNGVDEIYSGDTVYVEGYNEAFKVTKYENDTIKYLPFL